MILFSSCCIRLSVRIQWSFASKNIAFKTIFGRLGDKLSKRQHNGKPNIHLTIKDVRQYNTSCLQICTLSLPWIIEMDSQTTTLNSSMNTPQVRRVLILCRLDVILSSSSAICLMGLHDALRRSSQVSCNLKCVLYEKYKKVMSKVCSSSLQCTARSKSVLQFCLSQSQKSSLTHP